MRLLVGDAFHQAVAAVEFPGQVNAVV